jgi:hypothetical protein
MGNMPRWVAADRRRSRELAVQSRDGEASVRVPANQFLRLFDPDRAQIAGDRCADVGDCFEDCGQSRMGRLPRGQPRRLASPGGQAGSVHR